MNHKKALGRLTSKVAQFLTELDILMKEPSTIERGRKVASICNALEFTNDYIMRFELGYGKVKIQNRKADMERKKA